MTLTLINSIILAILIAYQIKRKFRKIYKRNLPPIIKAGKYSYSASNTFDGIVSHPDTKIGSYTSIAAGVKIGPAEHPINWISTHGFQYSEYSYGFVNKYNIKDTWYLTKPCKIGNDVWIGQNAIIKAGKNIGNGAIIGCGAVVTHDVPPYAIIAGVPARIIRYRFDKEIIEELLELEWWDYPEDIVAGLPFDDVKKCIEILKIYKNVK